MPKLHPLATTLALLILAESFHEDELEYAAHVVLTKAVSLCDWSDERKADLYARLADTLERGMRFADMEKFVSLALWANQNLYL